LFFSAGFFDPKHLKPSLSKVEEVKLDHQVGNKCIPGWRFQTFFIFTPKNYEKLGKMKPF